MTNYLTYLGLGITGYFCGYQIIFLLNTCYNALTNGNKMNYYKLFVMYLLYSSGFFKSVYIMFLILLYNFINDYESNMNKINKMIEEYRNFIKFYNDETSKDSTKISQVVELWKNTTLLYDQYLIKYYDCKHKIYENKYYIFINNLSLSPINERIESIVELIKKYLNIDHYYDFLKQEIKRISDPIVQSQMSQQPLSPYSVSPCSVSPYSVSPYSVSPQPLSQSHMEMHTMKELDELIKTSFNSDVSNFSNIDNFIASLNDLPSTRKRKKKVPKKPPVGFNNKNV